MGTRPRPQWPRGLTPQQSLLLPHTRRDQPSHRPQEAATARCPPLCPPLPHTWDPRPDSSLTSNPMSGGPSQPAQPGALLPLRKVGQCLLEKKLRFPLGVAPTGCLCSQPAGCGQGLGPSSPSGQMGWVLVTRQTGFARPCRASVESQ